MPENMRLTVSADTIVEGEKIATFGALMNLQTMEVTMTARYIDKEACKEHRDIVRADQAGFEDFVYWVQDKLKAQSAE